MATFLRRKLLDGLEQKFGLRRKIGLEALIEEAEGGANVEAIPRDEKPSNESLFQS